MSHTYHQLLYHFVFSTKYRQPWISAEIEERLFPYIAGIVKRENGTLIMAGGMPDHIHLLVRWRTDTAVADLMRSVKANSSRWLHANWPAQADFAWQEGYGAFTVSASQEPKVKAYIGHQRQHHEGRSFEDEFVLLLQQHGVEFDPRYLWK